MSNDFDINCLMPQPPNTEKDRKHKLEDEQLTRSYKRVLNTPDGRLMYKDLLSKCHVFHSTFDNNQKLQDYREGRRSIGLYLISRGELETIESLKDLEKEIGE